jgi:hypothetical protein
MDRKKELSTLLWYKDHETREIQKQKLGFPLQPAKVMMAVAFKQNRRKVHHMIKIIYTNKIKL